MKILVKSILLCLYSWVRRDPTPKVVFYHDIGTDYTPMGTPVELFKRHLEILAQHEARGTKHVICFDDGFRGLWDHREMLKEVKAKGAIERSEIAEGLREQRSVKVFIAVGLVGKPGYLTWDEIRTLNREYSVDFQCHTWSHQTLVGPWNDDDVPREERTEAWYERELIASREKIAAELGKIVDELCFPVGYFSDELIERCKQAGYRKVYASYPGNLGEGEDEGEGYVQPRCLAQDLSPRAFKAMLKGGLNVFKARYLALHKVG